MSEIIKALIEARNLLEGYAKHDDRTGHHEDAEYCRQRIAKIDAILAEQLNDTVR